MIHMYIDCVLVRRARGFGDSVCASVVAPLRKSSD